MNNFLNDKTEIENFNTNPIKMPNDFQLVSGFKRYNKFRKIALGGVGIVNSCYDPRLNRYVAIKELQDNYRDNTLCRSRFLREARIMARLEHPSIVPVHDIGMKKDGAIYFTMEKVDGKDLSIIIQKVRQKKHNSLDARKLSKLIDLFLHICNATAYAHSQGVIHRDLKPANIMIGKFDEVRIMDWGLAKILGEKEVETDPQFKKHSDILNLKSGDITHHGVITGTPRYMAPEQVTGSIEEQGKHTDIYSLGAILYEILTLEPAIKGETTKDILQQVMQGATISIQKRELKRQIPNELKEICLKAMQKNPTDRYKTVIEITDDLRNFQNGFQVSVYHSSLTRKVSKFCSRNFSTIAIIMATVFTAVTIFISHQVYQKITIHNLLKQADTIKEQADGIMLRKFQVLKKLQTIENQTTTKQLLTTEIKNRQHLKVLHEKSESLYDVATTLYLTSPQSKKNKHIYRSLNDIIQQRINYARRSGNQEEAQRIFAYIESLKDISINFAYKNITNMHELYSYIHGYSSIKIHCDNDISVQVLRISQTTNSEKEIYKGTLPITLDKQIAGSYIIKYENKNHDKLCFSLFLNLSKVVDVNLQCPDTVPEGLVFIPAGDFLAGGIASRYERQFKHKIPGFFIKKHEVTIAEYMEFWLAKDGADRRMDFIGMVRTPLSSRKFQPSWNRNGKLLEKLDAKQPIAGIPAEAAKAFCQWLTIRNGQFCRLPTIHEWEKAARGADGRNYPWGNILKTNYAFIDENDAALLKYDYFAPVGSFSNDCSLYGVFDMGGNVREWSSSYAGPHRKVHLVKGSSRYQGRFYLNCSSVSEVNGLSGDTGFRYIYPYNK